MIDKAIETLLTVFFTLMISIGVGVTFIWASKSIKETCSKSVCCKKKFRWECKKCGDVVRCNTQPYCKTCGHIERIDVKMVKKND